MKEKKKSLGEIGGFCGFWIIIFIIGIILSIFFKLFGIDENKGLNTICIILCIAFFGILCAAAISESIPRRKSKNDASKSNNASGTPIQWKKCPHCNKDIPVAETICYHCQKNISTSNNISTSKNDASEFIKNLSNPSAIKICPYCHKEIFDGETRCPYCHMELPHFLNMTKASYKNNIKCNNKENKSKNNIEKNNKDNKPKRCPICRASVLHENKVCYNCGFEVRD